MGIAHSIELTPQQKRDEIGAEVFKYNRKHQLIAVGCFFFGQLIVLIIFGLIGILL